MRRRNKKKYQAQRKLVVVLFLIAVSILIVRLKVQDIAAYEYSQTDVYQVSNGDTLWDIAAQYSNETHDTRKVIGIMQELDSDLTPSIYCGQSIIVPLFNNIR